MQKIEFIKILRDISEKLHSPQLEALTVTDVANMLGGNKPWEPRTILPLLIDSKSRYDGLIVDPLVNRILEIMGAPAIYSTENFAVILQQVAASQNLHDVYHRKLFGVFLFHSALQRQLQISTDLLLNDQALIGDHSEAAGVTIFELTDPTSSLDLDRLSKIIDALQDLCRIVQLALTPAAGEPVSPRVLLLDSGSSVALAIKTSAETAGALFQVFKEVWDWMVNREHYKNRVQAESVSRNLSLLEQINAAGATGALTPERVKEYSEIIERRTDRLIELGVLPKKLASESTTISHIVMLESIGTAKQLPARSAEREDLFKELTE